MASRHPFRGQVGSANSWGVDYQHLRCTMVSLDQGCVPRVGDKTKGFEPGSIKL